MKQDTFNPTVRCCLPDQLLGCAFLKQTLPRAAVALALGVLLWLGMGISQAATRITATISITNLPLYVTNTLTWNGTSNRFWTNAAISFQHIPATNTIANSATNLKQNLDLYKFRTWHVVQFGSASNQVQVLAGTNEPIAISIGGLWAVVTYVTNTVYVSDYVLMPPNAFQSNTFLTWQMSALVTNLWRSTSSVPADAYFLTNYLNLSAVLQNATNKNFYRGTSAPAFLLATQGNLVNVTSSNMLATNLTGSLLNPIVLAPTNWQGIFSNVTAIQVTNLDAQAAQIASGSASNIYILNALSMRGVVTALSNGVLYHVTVTNASWANATNANLGTVRIDTLTVWSGATMTNFSSPGSGSFSQQIGSGGAATNGGSVQYGRNGLAGGVYDVSVGQSALSFGYDPANGGNVTLGGFAETRGDGNVTIGRASYNDGTNNTFVGREIIAGSQATGMSALGAYSTVEFDYATAIGYGANPTAANQIRLGRSTETVSVPGTISSAKIETTYASVADNVSNRQTGPWSFKIGSYTGMSSAGSGVNLVTLPTNRWNRLSGNAADCLINGMTGDSAEREVGIFNASAYTMTILHNSGGGGGTTSQRFALPNSASIALTPGSGMLFIHDETAGAWVPVNAPAGATATATNLSAVSGSLATNTAAFSYVTNPIVSGLPWTNNTGARVELKVTWTLSGSAVSGFPSLCMTNMASGEFYNPTNSFVLAAVSSGRSEFHIGPGEWFVTTNKSSGAASATVDASFAVKQ